MRMYYKNKYMIIMIVVLTMLFQVVGPVASGFVYADEMVKDFRVTGIDIVEGKAIINWIFTFDPSSEAEENYKHQSDFTVDEEKQGQVIGNDETLVGEYIISEAGLITITIDKSLKDRILDFPKEEPVEPIDPVEPMDPVEPVEPVEPNEDGETDLKDGIIGKILGFVASISDLEDLFLGKESIDEPAKTFTFSGSFEVEGVVEKPKMMSLMKPFSSEGIDIGNIFEFQSLTIKEDGKPDKSIGQNTPIEIDEDTVVTIKYDWNIIGKGAKNGDWSSTKIPDIFNTVGPFPPGNIKLTDGKVVGTYTILGGILKFNFGKGIDGLGVGLDGLGDVDLLGTYIEFGFKLNFEQFEKDVTQEIKFEGSVDKDFTIIVKPKAVASSITKIGLPDGTGVGNKKDVKTIKWTIDVMNTEETQITGAKITEDTIPEGLSFKAGSFNITKLSMGYNDKKEINGLPNPLADPTGLGFEILLPDMEPYSGYRIEYTTKIEDYNKTTFTNTAKLSHGSKSATATVGGITRSAPIEKKGAVISGKDEIRWTIDVNKAGMSITNPIVKDTLPAGLTVKVVGGVKQVTVSKRNASGNYIAVNPAIDVSNFPDKIELPEIGPEDVYQIIYTTSIDYTLVNGGVYQKDNTFTNSATLFDGETQVGIPVKIPVTVTRLNILNKIGIKPVKYGDALTWTLNVNQPYHKINGATVTDKIPKGLDFDPDKVTIRKRAKGGNWITLTGAGKPSISVVAGVGADLGKNIVTIPLGDIQEEFEIKYTTKINNAGFGLESFENEAYLTGTGVGTGVGTSGNTIKKGVTPDNNNYTKESVSINYDEKWIQWKITIDPVKEPITQLKIVDTFPNKGLIFLPNSLEVKKGTTVLENVIGTTYYTFNPNTEGIDTGYQKGFTLEFTNNTLPLSGQQLVITYKTSYDPQLVVVGNKLDPYIGTDKKYKNKAVITGKTNSGQDITKTLEKEASPSNENESSWNSGKKEGKRINIIGGVQKVGWESGYDRLVEWKIYTNYLAQNLGPNVVVTDTLQFDGKIDLSSVIIKEYSVNSSNGSTSDGTELGSVNYTKTLSNSDKTLTIDFGAFNVDKRYVIIYTTTVPDKSLPSYGNSANVKVGLINYPYSTSVSYDKSGAFIGKNALDLTGATVYTDDEIDWEIVANESLSKVKGIIVTDVIGKGMAYKLGSLEVYKVEGISKTLVDATAYGLLVTGDHNTSTTLIVNLGDIEHKYIIKYKTIVMAKNGNVNNNASIAGTTLVKTTVPIKTFSATKFASTGGYVDPKKGKIRITKVDGGMVGKPIINNNTTEAQFKLYYKLNGADIAFNDGGVFTTINGVLEIANLPIREYELEEVTAPKGYQKVVGRIPVNVNNAYNNIEANTISVVVENIKIKTEITGKKVWIGGPTIKPTIKLQLYKNGIAEGAAVTLNSGETEYKWTGLDLTNNAGTDHIYTVDEVTIPEYYIKTISKTGSTVTIINTHTIPKKDITATKKWVNGPTPRPTIKIQLYRQLGDGDILSYGSSITFLNGQTSHTWNDLPLINENSIKYKYTVQEVGTPENYTKVEDGLTVTNTYVSPKTTVKGTKVWVNGPTVKPTIELQLYRDNISHLAPITLNNGTTEYTWTGLDKTDITGKDYVYTVQEVGKPENYTKVESGLTVTNTYVSPKTTVKGTKVWVNGPTVKPTIELQLYRDNISHVAPITLNNGTTEYTWTSLDKTDIAGKDYVYTVQEVGTSENYTKVESGLIVTNTYVSPTTDITGTKVWVNGPVVKPTIKLQLYRNGIAHLSPETLENGTLKYVWKGLDKTDSDGINYVYTVQEVGTPENYTKVEDGLTVTNTYVSPKTTVKGTKVWVNGPVVKPTIELQLYRDNISHLAPITLNNGTTEYTWTSLDKTDIAGKDYVYTIDEVKTPENYGKSISIDQLTITNTYGSPKTDIIGKKIWANGPEPRPTIELQLYRDGGPLDVPVELKSGEISYNWKGLDKTDIDGKEYVYTVDEVKVPSNYTKSLDSLTVTNTYVSPKTEVKGTKIWIESPGTKPTIELQLYRDGEALGAPIKLVDGELEYTWKNLDETDNNGVRYKYTVDEVKIPSNYRKSQSVDGLTITNRYYPPEEPYYPPVNPPKDPPKDPKPVDPETTDPVDPPTDPTPVDPPTDPEIPVKPPTNKEETTPKDTPKEGEVEVPEGGIPKVNTLPENGTVTVGENGKWTYTPNPGFEGKDKFSIIITNPDGTEDEIFFDIDIETPLGTVDAETLPKSGQVDSILFYLAGLFFIIIGIFLRKRTV